MDQQDLFIAQEYIKEFMASKERKLMLDGEAYYKNEPSNIVMPHAFMANLVDEKIQYILGKEPTIASTVDNSIYIETVTEVLGHTFLYQLNLLATEFSNKGIAWEQVYFEDSKLKRMLIPSEQVIPVWTDNSHTKLQWLIRVYDVENYKGDKKDTVTKVEIYTDTNTFYYVLEHDKLILDSEKYLKMSDDKEFGHFELNGEQYSFNRPPFLWCKNNAYEIPDIKFVKALIDKYCDNRERLDSLLEDFKNFLVVIRGYSGDIQNVISLDEMLENRRIFVDEGGSVDLVTPTIDTTANNAHNEALKDDIVLFGRSVDRNKMVSGNAPSGVALKTLYSGLDLKCNKAENEIIDYFSGLLYFVNTYLELTGTLTQQDKERLTLILNRDITMNESAVITDCKNSVGVISSKTIIANHPYVTDIDEELKQIEAENNVDLQEYVKKIDGANNGE